MKVICRSLSVLSAVLAAGTVFTLNAAAQCGAAGDGHATMNNASSALSRSVPLHTSAKTPSNATLQERGDDRNVSIVGFWHVVFISEGTKNPPIPDGVPVDMGFAQWHSDNTEILNSSRPPATANFCLGVWTQTGRRTYSLNHYAMSFNPDGTFLGPANIKENVTLSSDGNSYTGSFSIDQYDTQLNLLAHIVGNINATRVTVNTKPTDLF